MNVKLDKIENSEAYLEFEIEADVFDKGLQKAYKKVVKNLDVPGFRKGTASRAVVEAHFGLKILLEDAMELVVPDAYHAAIKELNLNTMGEPDIEVGYVESGKPVTVKVIVPIRPEVILGQIEGLEVTVSEAKPVTDADIDKYLQDLIAQNKTVIEKNDEPAAVGDTVTFDYKGFVEGTVFQGEDNFKLLLGSDTFIPGFEEQLIGVIQGDHIDVKLKFDEEHPSKTLAGKNAVFNVTVKKVENIQARKLDDQFAREVANVNNLEELRSEARIKLLERSSIHSSEQTKQAVVAAALDQCDCAVPEYLVMERATTMLDQFKQQLESQGGSIDMYLQLAGSNVENLKRDIWKDAKRSTRISFMLDKIIEEKGFEVSEEELDNGIEDFAIQIGMNTENAKQNLGPLVDQVIYKLKTEKAIQYMVDNAVIKIVKALDNRIA